MSRSLSPSELRTLYLDLLRRPAFDGERKSILDNIQRATDGDPGPASLITGPTDQAGLTKALVASRDFWQQWFQEQLYYFLLVDNFAPHGETMVSIPDELSAGKLDVRDAIHRIALSSSFDQRNPGADTFVTVVMEQLGGLAVEKNRRELEIGKAVYDGKPGSFLGRQGSSQSDIVRNAIEQRSFAEAFLSREYRRYVHAVPDKRALGQWVSSFVADPKCFAELAGSWCASPAYEARFTKREPMDNRLFVRSMMVDLCQREPTPEEFSRLRSALDGLSDPQPLRSVMARMLLDSGQTNVPASKDGLDAAGFVEDQFRHLLGRDPSDKEAVEFAAGLADSDGKPTMIVYALITSPEYQSY
ncbi:MAG TPA: hypothetical protein VK843_19355 [Planctomycetota bacterium]|nr:hypothetical protein [Planctomycetota bacterium]